MLNVLIKYRLFDGLDPVTRRDKRSSCMPCFHTHLSMYAGKLRDFRGYTCREKFFTHVRDVCQDSFKVSIDKVLGHLTMSGKVKEDNIRSLFFGDYLHPEGERIYDEIVDFKELSRMIEQSVSIIQSINQIFIYPST